ncbi:MAG: UDP-N-acetylmuramyl-tripeptide synthetase [Candidatus Paceibacterota bacterium]
MIEKILRTIQKIIPKKLYKAGQPFYHFSLAFISAVICGFPSKKLKIVGITGTKGKTTTSELVASILRSAGYKVALANSIHFVIGEKDTRNMHKMSMPGRGFMQKFLKKALKENCHWVVLELTSEGSKQFRHKFIDLDAFIFTNLQPEHIESHGSFEKYKEAKIALGESLIKKPHSILVVNGDDVHSKDFLEKVPASKKVSYSLESMRPFKTDDGVEMRFQNSTIYSKLHGEFNANNILSAITFAESININEKIIKEGIENVRTVSGRAEKIISAETFEVYVDYAHTPDSLLALYSSFPNQEKVCVLGNTGGGRDTWKRPAMAEIADKYCDAIILTNEDPYDENPDQIVKEMSDAILDKSPEIIMDRRFAIRKAMELASKKANAVVLITGKGTDPYIMGANGTKEPWSDADVVREEFAKLKN